MLIQLFIGGVINLITILFHAFSLDFIIRNMHWAENPALLKFRNLRKALVITIVVMGLFAAITVEIWIWASFFMLVDALPDWETALYYTTSTFTTVGFGDIVLDKDWRLLGSITSANGFLLFGWSIAFIFEIVFGVYHRENKEFQS